MSMLIRVNSERGYTMVIKYRYNWEKMILLLSLHGPCTASLARRIWFDGCVGNITSFIDKTATFQPTLADAWGTPGGGAVSERRGGQSARLALSHAVWRKTRDVTASLKVKKYTELVLKMVSTRVDFGKTIALVYICQLRNIWPLPISRPGICSISGNNAIVSIKK